MSQPSSVPPVTAAPSKPWKILLIDASAEFAKKFRSLLEGNTRFELAEWYDSGVGWVNLWQTIKPDFLFVSLELSKRDGHFCVEKVKSLDPQIIVVFMHDYSGALGNDVEMKALARGAACVLQRPFSDERFHTTLRRLEQQKSKISNIKRLKFA